MPSPAATVYIVDDDPSVLRSLARLVGSAGCRVKTFDRAAGVLESSLLKGPSCLVLDLQMPGLGGLDLQKELAARGLALSVIFLTGYGDVPSSVKAMKAGAVDFLTKPVRGEVLLNSIKAALEKDRARLRDQRRLDLLRQRIETLSPREFQVLRWVIAGSPRSASPAARGS